MGPSANTLEPAPAAETEASVDPYAPPGAMQEATGINWYFPALRLRIAVAALVSAGLVILLLFPALDLFELVGELASAALVTLAVAAPLCWILLPLVRAPGGFKGLSWGYVAVIFLIFVLATVVMIATLLSMIVLGMHLLGLNP
jgi:hypothetical protein